MLSLKISLFILCIICFCLERKISNLRRIYNEEIFDLAQSHFSSISDQLKSHIDNHFLVSEINRKYSLIPRDEEEYLLPKNLIADED